MNHVITCVTLLRCASAAGLALALSACSQPARPIEWDTVDLQPRAHLQDRVKKLDPKPLYPPAVDDQGQTIFAWPADGPPPGIRKVPPGQSPSAARSIAPTEYSDDEALPPLPERTAAAPRERFIPPPVTAEPIPAPQSSGPYRPEPGVPVIATADARPGTRSSVRESLPPVSASPYPDPGPTSSALAAPSPSPTSAGAGMPITGDSYVVQPGDTLFSVARRAGRPVMEVATRNRLAEPWTIKAGQQLTLRDPEPLGSLSDPAVGRLSALPQIAPASDAPASVATASPASQTVQAKPIFVPPPGSLPPSAAHAATQAPEPVSVPSVAAALPALEPSATGGLTHTVQPGESLFSIARRYGQRADSVGAANGLTPPWSIRAGQTLRIPAAGESVSLVSASPKAPTAALPQLATAAAPETATTSAQPAQKSGAAALAEPLPPSFASAIPRRSSQRFLWPVANGRMISGFGDADGGNRSDGVVIAAPVGAPVSAAENGIVAYAGSDLPGLGNVVIIEHADGYTTTYSHADQLLVGRGQGVQRGDVIASVGRATQASAGLHFEVRRSGTPLDPVQQTDLSMRQVSSR